MADLVSLPKNTDKRKVKFQQVIDKMLERFGNEPKYRQKLLIKALSGWCDDSFIPTKE